MHNSNIKTLPDVRYLASGSKILKFQDPASSLPYSFRDYKKQVWTKDTTRKQKRYDRLSAQVQLYGDTSYIGQAAQKKLNKLSESNNLSVSDSDKMSQINSSSFDNSNIGKFANSTAGTITGMGADIASGMINAHSKVDESESQKAAKDAILKGVSMIPGWGTAAASALKLADSIGNATGLNLDAMSKDQAEAAGINGWARIGNNLMGALPANFGGAFAGNTIDSYNTREAMELSDAFGGTTGDIATAGTMGGKSYMFGRNQANDFISAQNRNVDTLTSLNQTNSIRKRASGEQFGMQNNNIYSGRSIGYDKTYLGREGLKLVDKDLVKNTIKSYNNSLIKAEVKEIETFANGGVIGVDTSILPEGSLHKDLNHLEDVNPEVGEEVTTKGIPVIVTDENCNITQVAEIEKEEIILRKEITTKLEELWKDGSEEAMILAGKILAEEIITNTQDNTGQLEGITDGEQV